MKVFDLKCAKNHVFEGWFASEEDFVTQCNMSLVQCPVCGDPSVVKQLSAPRLLLSGGRTNAEEGPLQIGAATEHQDLTAAWLAIARKVVANTTDVGGKFAQEARKMHYGESPERAIRGTATVEETRALVEEGIDIVPFPLPESAKESLQ